MPCLIITGYPSSGKSTMARLLRDRALLRDDVDSVVILNEESVLQSTSGKAYANNLSEKQTRGALKAALDRAIAAADRTCLILLDSLNYIKGQRYELYCLSKAASQKHGVLWVRNYYPVSAESNEHEKTLCDQWNATKEQPTDQQLMDELMQRYEPPDSKNRWEDPLFVVGVHHHSNTPNETGALSTSSRDATTPALSQRLASKVGFKRRTKTTTRKEDEKSTTDDSELSLANVPEAETVHAQVAQEATPQDISLEQRLDDILHSFLEQTKQLQQGTSTRYHVSTDVDTMHAVDTVTHQVVRDLIRLQNTTTTTGLRLEITVDETILIIELMDPIPPAKLQRLRGQYLNWVRTHPLEEKTTTSAGMAQHFLKYIQQAS